MKLSEIAWKSSSKVIDSIKAHPFNQELMSGTLERTKFAYYIEQDKLYLNDFAKCLAIIATKISSKYAADFLLYSKSIYHEQENVHQYFSAVFNFQESKLITTATITYTSYLLRTCTTEPVEIAVAAVLPCFWIYEEVGLYIANQSANNNPYSRWIEIYAGDDFGTEVTEAINIFDELADSTTDEIKNKMIDAFYISTCLEWHFWNDAYNSGVYDTIQI